MKRGLCEIYEGDKKVLTERQKSILLSCMAGLVMPASGFDPV